MIGKIISGVQALGPIIKILLRSSHLLVARETENFACMDTSIILTDQAYRELTLLKENIKKLNGKPIILSKTGITFQQVLNIADSSNLPFKLSASKPEPEVKGVFREVLPTEIILDIMGSLQY